MSWDELAAPGLVCAPSPADTARFGLAVHRLTVGADPFHADELTALVEESPADVLVVRYDVGRQEVPSILAATSRAVLPAGALSYWETPVRADTTPLRTFVVASVDLDPAAAARAVRAVVRASFATYGNHYTADPLFDPDAALAGYEEWAMSSLQRDPEHVLVQFLGDEAIGVATVDEGSDHVEVLLAGLIPSAQGHGLYGDLLAAVEARAAGQGLGRLVISTQVQNVRVQRAWVRRGLRPFAAVETVHLVHRESLIARGPRTS